MGQEEIESRYSDGQEIDEQINEYKLNIDEVNQHVDNILVDVNNTNRI